MQTIIIFGFTGYKNEERILISMMYYNQYPQ